MPHIIVLVETTDPLLLPKRRCRLDLTYRPGVPFDDPFEKVDGDRIPYSDTYEWEWEGNDALLWWWKRATIHIEGKWMRMFYFTNFATGFDRPGSSGPGVAYFTIYNSFFAGQSISWSVESYHK